MKTTSRIIALLLWGCGVTAASAATSVDPAAQYVQTMSTAAEESAAEAIYSEAVTAAAALASSSASNQGNVAAMEADIAVDSITTVTTVTTVTTTYRTVRRDDLPHASAPSAPVAPAAPIIAAPADDTEVALVPLPVLAEGGASTPAIVGTPRSGGSTRIQPDSTGHYPVNERGKIVLATIDPELLASKVVVGNDTVPFIIPDRNFGRYDRGLFNFLVIPHGQWMFGLTASYGAFSTEDVQILSFLNDFNFQGKTYSLSPSVAYFFRNNQSIGFRFKYSHAGVDLSGLSVDFDDDLNFSLSDISYYSHSYTSSVFYRNYVGLGAEKRFAIFNEVDLSFGSGHSVFSRLYNAEPKETHTYTTKFGLNFSPGFTMFIMDNVCFNISFGVFGLHVTHDRQVTDGVTEGKRTSSGANFRFNLFNINFGLGVCI